MKKRRRVLVTGGCGFIGSHLVDSLVESGIEVVVVDNLRTGKIEFLNPHALYFNNDINSLDNLSDCFEGIDEVYHLAANADVRDGWADPWRDVDSNFLTSLKLIEFCVDKGVKNFIFASTGSVYGEAVSLPTREDSPILQQTSLYAASKISTESFLGAYAKAEKLRVHIFRLVSVLGSRYTHGHVYDFVKKLKIDSNRLQVLGNGNQTKSYVSIHDCVKALQGLRGSQPFEIFNIGTNETLSVKQSLGIILNMLGLNPNLEFGSTESGWIGDNPKILLDIEKARSFGWSPMIPIRDALEETVDWLSENDWVFSK